MEVSISCDDGCGGTCPVAGASEFRTACIARASFLTSTSHRRAHTTRARPPTNALHRPLITLDTLPSSEVNLSQPMNFPLLSPTSVQLSES